MKQLRVSVDELVPGLYVSELDRPWTETPFLFQGFMVETEADIRALREHCEYVWVDGERSRELPASTPRPDGSGTGSQQVKDASASDVISLSKRLHQGMRDGLAARRFAAECLAQAFERIRRKEGGAMSNRLVQSAARLDGLVASYPEVAHWLANLQQHEDRLLDHSINVSLRALLLARELELPPAEVAAVGFGALLHDIGKLSLSPELLNKPGPLSREEWGQIRRHPLIGSHLLAGGALPDTVQRIVRYHHERIDGQGFPEGLKGNELELPIRVVAVANAYDSMTSNRLDRPRLSGYQAVTTLMRDADNTWGRSLVEAFVRCTGIYPAGTRVRLGSGAEAVVVHTPVTRRLQPVVCIYRRPDGSSDSRLPLYDLAAVSANERQQYIDQVIEPDGGEQELLQVITREAFAA
ncbi:HD domain-containing phosphohydrolase [Gammaproteobacteria bacterium AB-CW1]|uniref:HD domain-containing phosphohydrolase n=1 Tax=Natronospira elongata TaxID=3110268 RepID=A0AAP6MKJ9_9GAMM|nr:HD domain-containing phosphohydrolase [Gammaproteobacteria bacterium AB-CW1]